VIKDLRLASNGGHGTLEALQVAKILQQSEIPCSFCGVSALIYYGAGRIRDDWEKCIPSNLMHKAESLLKSELYAQDFINVPSRDSFQPGSLVHTYPRFQGRGMYFYFVLVPLDDIHINLEVSKLQRSHNDLPYPKLHDLIQSFIDSNDVQITINNNVDANSIQACARGLRVPFASCQRQDLDARCPVYLWDTNAVRRVKKRPHSLELWRLRTAVLASKPTSDPP